MMTAVICKLPADCFSMMALCQLASKFYSDQQASGWLMGQFEGAPH
jgi:hypothetical protein